MKRIFNVCFALLVAVTMMATPRTAEQAAEIAAQFTNVQPQLRRLHKAPRTAAKMRLVKTAYKANSTNAAYYVFNQENKNGFVIIAGDDLAPDVLLYSNEGEFDAKNINPNFKFWLNRIQEEMSVITPENAAAPRKAKTRIEPLLGTIRYDQLSPYNDICPIDDLDDTRCYTGCVATATAQIMRKWKHPAKGVGSKTYTWSNCIAVDSIAEKCTKTKDKELTVNFGETTYDWDNMKDKYTHHFTDAQAKAISVLMYHCGVAAEMEYGGEKIGGSGAFTDVMGKGLREHFRYNVEKFITTYKKKEYGEAAMEPAEYEVSTAEFIAYFDADLEAGRPILMGGESPDFGGHEFVCDGRDENGNYHINWGWHGASNCYTALTVLKPEREEFQFSHNIDALVGLEPNNGTAIENTESDNLQNKATKSLDANGQLFIISNGIKYNTIGQRIQ